MPPPSQAHSLNALSWVCELLSPTKLGDINREVLEDVTEGAVPPSTVPSPSQSRCPRTPLNPPAARSEISPSLATMLSMATANPTLWKEPTFLMAMAAVTQQLGSQSQGNPTTAALATQITVTPVATHAAATATCPPVAPVPEKTRRTCRLVDCTNIARTQGLCQRHGGKKGKPACTHEGCHRRAVRGGRCHRHGAPPRFCGVEGCKLVVVKGGRCIRHGAWQCRKTCCREGCRNVAIRDELCGRHGASNLLGHLSPI